jgi:hypothetical protein
MLRRLKSRHTISAVLPSALATACQEASMPSPTAEKAECVIVIPSMTKVAMGVDRHGNQRESAAFGAGTRGRSAEARAVQRVGHTGQDDRPLTKDLFRAAIGAARPCY